MDTFRYIITRTCLREGSLQLQRSFKGHFPAEGTVKLFAPDGREYDAEVGTGGRLLGVGTFYREHGLDVNDVVLITPLVAGCYKVEGVIKPRSRPDLSRERSAAATLTPRPSTGWSVTDSSPHVREIRAHHGAVPPQSQPWASMQLETVERAERASRYVVSPLGHTPLDHGPEHGPAGLGVEEGQGGNTPALTHPAEPGSAPQGAAAPAGGRRVRINVQARTSAESPELPVDRLPVPQTIDLVAADFEVAVRPVRVQNAPLPAAPTPSVSVQARVQDPAACARPRSQVGTHGIHKGSASAASERLLRDLAAAPAELRRPQRTPAHAEDTHRDPAARADGGGDFGPPNEPRTSSGFGTALPAGGTQVRADNESLIELLAAVARRCGYRVDYPVAELSRLRADLGSHSYTVLVAHGPQALAAPEWCRSLPPAPPTYQVWCAEDRGARAGVGEVALDRSTLQALAQMAPDRLPSLTELQVAWAEGGLSAEWLALLTARQRTQDQEDHAFLLLLRALADQSAQSLVSAPRLLQKLSDVPGGNVSAAQLETWLADLSASPWRLLIPLGGEDHLLRQEVSQRLLVLAAAWRDPYFAGPASPEAQLERARFTEPRTPAWTSASPSAAL